MTRGLCRASGRSFGLLYHAQTQDRAVKRAPVGASVPSSQCTSPTRELLAAFNDRQAPARLFGLTGDTGAVRLPAFTRVAAYQSQDGQIELDALAEGPAPWLVEVKWRNRPVSRADLEGFAQKTRIVVERLKLANAPTLWVVSGGGFKASALAYAAEAGILVSAAQDMQELAELLGVRFGK